MKEGIAHQPLLVPADRVIAILCGTKISALDCLDLSQSTRVTDEQNYDSQDRASIAASRGKNETFVYSIY